MLLTAEGIVLKQRKIAGNRRMIVLFTKEYGKISAGTGMNERSKGKAALALRPFTYAEYHLFKNRSSYSINSAEVRCSYYTVGEDLDRYLVASRFIEYLDAVLQEEQARPRLFSLSIEFLESVARAKGGCDTLFFAFVVKSLSMQGVMPELKNCVDCGKPLEEIRRENGGKADLFAVDAGGILCPHCAAKEKSDSGALLFKGDFDIVDILQYFAKQPLSVFEKVVLKPQISGKIKRILSEYLNYYLGVKVLEEELQFR